LRISFSFDFSSAACPELVEWVFAHSAVDAFSQSSMAKTVAIAPSPIMEIFLNIDEIILYPTGIAMRVLVVCNGKLGLFPFLNFAVVKVEICVWWNNENV
jgi:hypothetical protein